MVQETQRLRAVPAAYDTRILFEACPSADYRTAIHTVFSAVSPALLWLQPTKLLQCLTAEARLAAIVGPTQLTVQPERIYARLFQRCFSDVNYPAQRPGSCAHKVSADDVKHAVLLENKLVHVHGGAVKYADQHGDESVKGFAVVVVLARVEDAEEV